jgi:hypothetical protein
MPPARLKADFPGLVIVGSAYSYLQHWLPHVAQHVIRHGMADFIGLGRMVLSYPTMAADILAGAPLAQKFICRTFSDCTTGPRLAYTSGCYPLDPFYAARPEGRDDSEGAHAGAPEMRSDMSITFTRRALLLAAILVAAATAGSAQQAKPALGATSSSTTPTSPRTSPARTTAAVRPSATRSSSRCRTCTSSSASVRSSRAPASATTSRKKTRSTTCSAAAAS